MSALAWNDAGAWERLDHAGRLREGSTLETPAVGPWMYRGRLEDHGPRVRLKLLPWSEAAGRVAFAARRLRRFPWLVLGDDTTPMMRVSCTSRVLAARGKVSWPARVAGVPQVPPAPPVELGADVMHAVMLLPDMSEARNRARTLAIEAREAPADPWPPALPLASLADTATALLERAEALDRDLNAGPVCRDPFLSGRFLAGACLERERRRCGRKPWKWDPSAMCAACAASHLASLTADRLRALAGEERERWTSLTLAAIDLEPEPIACNLWKRAARLHRFGDAWRAYLAGAYGLAGAIVTAGATRRVNP